MTLVLATTASLLYLYAFGQLWREMYLPERPVSRRPLAWLVTGALLIHTLALAQTLFVDQHINIALGNILSLIALLSVLILLIANLTKPVIILGIFIFPLSAVSVFLPHFLPQTQIVPLSLGSHIILSISAYSILTLATAQAILYSVQEQRFREKKVGAILNILPPLQTMEKTLIQSIVLGFIFLSMALVSGFFFVQDIFAQHLIHKTFFALFAWIVYAWFLWGHFQKGWRGQKAARYIVWAYTLLFLSYIGTSFILMWLYT